MPTGTVRIATDTDVSDMARVLARGFHDDPVWRWMAPTHRRWPQRMVPVFRHLVRPLTGYGSAWTTSQHEGVAAWAPPGRSSFPDSAAARSLPAMLGGFGVAGLRRTLKMVTAMEAAHPREPHWYLEFLATDAHLRGRGVGSALIVPALEWADDDGVGAYLESSKFDNVAFYRRHGFDVVEEMVAVDGAPPLWRMWRDPR